MKNTFLFVGLLFLFACQQPSKKEVASSKGHATPKIVLRFEKGQATKATPITLAFYDFYGNRIQYDHDFRDKNNQDLEINAEGPVFLKDLSFRQTSYLVYPGEVLAVKTGKDDFLGFISTNKTDKTRANELAFPYALATANLKSALMLEKSLEQFKGIMKSLKNSKVAIFLELIMIKKADPQKAIDYSTLRYEEQVKFLTSYAEKNKVSVDFKNRMLQFFAYNKVVFQLSVVYNELVKNKDSVFESRLPVLTKQLNCDSCLYIDSYKESILSYVKYIALAKKEQGLTAIYQTIKNSFNGKTADFATFTLIKMVLEQDVANYKNTLEQFKKDNKTQRFTAYLEKYAVAKNNITDKNTMLLRPNGTAVNLDTLLNQNKENVILLDFWASWCGPCKVNIPFSKKLEEKYKGQPVKFIYLSLDEQKSAWEVSNKQLGLSSSYLVMNNFKSNLAKDLIISTIPRYVLIDKKGKISYRDAPKPTDQNLTIKIDELLK